MINTIRFGAQLYYSVHPLADAGVREKAEALRKQLKETGYFEPGDSVTAEVEVGLSGYVKATVYSPDIPPKKFQLVNYHLDDWLDAVKNLIFGGIVPDVITARQIGGQAVPRAVRGEG